MDPELLVQSAFDVCSALDSYGIRAILTGGSAATFYAPEAYLSDDIDFILAFVPEGAPSAQPLTDIGFVLAPSGHYERNRVMVDFPKGPLSIGSDILGPEQYATYKREGQILHVLTPTDSVRNRLESYYAWNDFSARAAAVGVARQHAEQISFAAIREWTLREHAHVRATQRERFNNFLNDLRALGVGALPNVIDI